MSFTNQPILLVIGLVVVFVAILILWAIVASNCSNADASLHPVTGITAEDEGLDEGQSNVDPDNLAQQIAEDNRYGAFELVVEIEGGASWVQIDVDGNTQIAEILETGWKGSFTVTSSASITAGAPGYVKVFRGGIEAPLDTSSGAGILELKVEQRPITQNAQNADAANQR